MSGGVDSSVTAKLMVDQVCCFAHRLSRLSLSGVVGSRVMTLLESSCGTGMGETNPEPIRDANGRKTGRMCSWCLSIWESLAEWYACGLQYILNVFIVAR